MQHISPFQMWLYTSVSYSCAITATGVKLYANNISALFSCTFYFDISCSTLCKCSICHHTHTNSLQKPHAGCCPQVNWGEMVFLFGDVLYCLIKTAPQRSPCCSTLTRIAWDSSSCFRDIWLHFWRIIWLFCQRIIWLFCPNFTLWLQKSHLTSIKNVGNHF